VLSAQNRYPVKEKLERETTSFVDIYYREQTGKDLFSCLKAGLIMPVSFLLNNCLNSS